VQIARQNKHNKEALHVLGGMTRVITDLPPAVFGTSKHIIYSLNLIVNIFFLRYNDCILTVKKEIL
jgi:hypothetical protein